MSSSLARDIPFPWHLVVRDAEGNKLPAKRKPGRPCRLYPVATPDEMKWAKRVNAVCEETIRTDDLVVALDDGASPADRVWLILQALAEESAVLKEQIRIAQATNRQTHLPRTTSRRIDVLSKMARVVLDATKQGILDRGVDVDACHAIADLFLDTVCAAAEEVLAEPEDLVTLLWAKIEVWKEQVAAERGRAEVRS